MNPQQPDGQLEFDPAADLEATLSQAPARWVVYLFADSNGRPVQLLCVRNLRASLRRRLGDVQSDEPSKRIDYRQVVRKVFWWRVDSAFEADLAYLDLARQFFPDAAESMIASRPAWFVHVNPESQFPRYIKTTDVSIETGEMFGPLEDKADAARLIEQLEDWFDLCRYYNILTEAPHGKACAYKEMGRCPAPCDGSISIEQYRRLIDWSATVLRDPADFVRVQEHRMQQAAAELRFEIAAKIRQYVESLKSLGSGAYRHLRRLSDFRFVSLQHGPTAKSAKLFLVTSSSVWHVASLLREPDTSCGVLPAVLSAAQEHIGEIDHLRLGIVSHHLFSSKARGVFIPLEALDDRLLSRAYRQLKRQRAPDGGDDEGIMREAGPPGEIHARPA